MRQVLTSSNTMSQELTHGLRLNFSPEWFSNFLARDLFLPGVHIKTSGNVIGICSIHRKDVQRKYEDKAESSLRA